VFRLPAIRQNGPAASYSASARSCLDERVGQRIAFPARVPSRKPPRLEPGCPRRGTRANHASGKSNYVTRNCYYIPGAGARLLHSRPLTPSQGPCGYRAAMDRLGPSVRSSCATTVDQPAPYKLPACRGRCRPPAKLQVDPESNARRLTPACFGPRLTASPDPGIRGGNPDACIIADASGKAPRIPASGLISLSPRARSVARPSQSSTMLPPPSSGSAEPVRFPRRLPGPGSAYNRSASPVPGWPSHHRTRYQPEGSTSVWPTFDTLDTTWYAPPRQNTSRCLCRTPRVQGSDSASRVTIG